VSHDSPRVIPISLRFGILYASLCVGLAAPSAFAQEMEPKAYSASPVGANFLVASYFWSTGSVLLDPTLPIADVHADVQGLAFGVGHTFNLFGDLGLVSVALPVGWVDATGKVFEQAAEVTRSGLTDTRLKLSVNLRGNPAMTLREFATARSHADDSGPCKLHRATGPVDSR